MCMHSANFKLWFSRKERAWIGRGYKNYLVLTDWNKIDWRKLDKNYRMNVWLRANAYEGNVRNLRNNALTKSNIYESSSYTKGFHIWTNIKDAKSYDTTGCVFEVIYKNVLAFGQNSNGSSSPPYSGDCVIAEYMKILQRV